MLEAKNLTCVRDDRVLFNDLNIVAAAGDIVQIEGLNGAGKTSLLRILAGLSRADSGEIFWNQQNIRQQREVWHSQLLYLGHQPGVKAVLTPLENLAFYHAERSEQQLFAALAAIGLPGYEDLPVAQLSAGQQRRVALARLWLSNAALWILDEPFTAIDQSGIAALMSRFLRHQADGGTIILTTHQPLPWAHGALRKITLTGVEESGCWGE